MGIGLFRVILALTVVITHTHPIFGFTLGNPVIAVRSFFIISGFYMALILDKNYSKYRHFLTSRFLRIFPIYWAVLVLTVLAGLFAHFYRGNWGEMEDLIKHLWQLDWSSVLAIIGGNLLVFGRNTLMFLGIQPHTGLLIYSHSSYALPVWPFLLIPQAWTLGLELSFYLLIPWFARQKTGLVLVVIALSVLLKSWLSKHGYDSVLWTYRFFPTELAYFLLGLLSYRFYQRLSPSKASLMFGRFAFYLALLLLTFFNTAFNYPPFASIPIEWIYYILLALLIPFIFIYSKDKVVDRKIGEFSYPVYLSHILVLNTFGPLVLFRYIDNNYLAIVVFIISFAFSGVLLRYIQNPVEKWRLRLRDKVVMTKLVKRGSHV